ncbi:hypothetical protein BOTBODRAFT_217614 [Botryobasidium botryosum FD-172 SS1]|uniref:Uncharacterized protein n=1 Tax=Botryobasidium botryosum (strain FD-172 SS1) TaxID=930990 RepID=A0A067N4P9_BOTB1|nr:hypothetical protein BOTBODRAFT_217614 [Botryobasidium botryosum FD-172 SS1]
MHMASGTYPRRLPPWVPNGVFRPRGPLIQTLRVEGEFKEDTLELTILSRAGTSLRRVEIAKCRSVSLSTMSRLMDLVEEVELDGVEGEDDLAWEFKD